MIYLDPKSNSAFKKLFGDVAHKNIVISFLNAVLERQPGELIIDVVMNDPNNSAEMPILSKSIVYVRCTDQNNHQYIIEIQMVTQADYAARVQYYSLLAFIRQLASGDRYNKLVPVIFVGVLDFNLLRNKSYISHHFILDNATHERELKRLEFHFIELGKFEKEVDICLTMIDKWIYFLKHAQELRAIPNALKDEVFKEAFDVLEPGNWSRRELEACDRYNWARREWEEYDRYLDSIRSQLSQIEMAQALAEARGEAWGKLKEKLEVTRKLLRANMMGISAIAQLMELTEAQVQDVKREIDEE